MKSHFMAITLHFAAFRSYVPWITTAGMAGMAGVAGLKVCLHSFSLGQSCQAGSQARKTSRRSVRRKLPHCSSCYSSKHRKFTAEHTACSMESMMESMIESMMEHVANPWQHGNMAKTSPGTKCPVSFYRWITSQSATNVGSVSPLMWNCSKRTLRYVPHAILQKCHSTNATTPCCHHVHSSPSAPFPDFT